MDFYPHDIPFGDIEPRAGVEIRYQPDLARDTSAFRALMQFVRDFYKNVKNMEQAEIYNTMIDEAIRSNNIMGLHVLWKGVYYHDRDNPNFECDLLLALEVAELPMFLQCLNGYCDWGTLNGIEPLEYETMVMASSKNSDARVHEFVKSLEALLGDSRVFKPITSDDVDDPDNEDPDGVKRAKLFFGMVDKIRDRYGLSTLPRYM